jgi:hypothetical protein
MSPQSLDLNTVLGNKFFGIKLFNPDYLFDKGYQFIHFIFPFIFSGQNISSFKLLLSILSLFFTIIIAYCAIRMFEIRAREREHLRQEIEEYAHHQAEKQKQSQNNDGGMKNERWEKVLLYIFSQNLSDWKLAIIEADTMLETLMDQMSFKGENLGEKLKGADRDKFPGLTSAWEAHAVRNRIAHEGLSFEISHQEAKRVIALYEQIFKEFGYI